MNCRDFLKELNDYLDGELDPKLRAELSEHLTWCHNCFVVCNTTKQTIEIYRENEIYALPDDLRKKLHTAILSKCKKSDKASG